MRDILTITDLDGSPHRVTEAGLVYAYGDTVTCPVPLTLLSDGAKIPDWAAHGRQRVQRALKRFEQLGICTELRFDATHGRRYKLAAYGYATQPFSLERQRQRRLVLAAIDGIHDLRQHWLDAGCTEAELDVAMRCPEINVPGRVA